MVELSLENLKELWPELIDQLISFLHEIADFIYFIISMIT